MKATILLPLLLLAQLGRAAIVVPGANGTDGPLNITANTEIDLSDAVTGAWDQDNTANLGKGVYDPAKWAVVFKYTDVNIAAGATVTFKNHPSRAPVVWLVSGNVLVGGTLSLTGQSRVNEGSAALPEPGPGGFRGGGANYSSTVLRGYGFGPGGGLWVGGGSYLTNGSGTVSSTYGNPSLIPLIGGSGGTGNNHSGGAGGGAMLIAARNFVQIEGILAANGGNAGEYHTTGAGSGGAVRILCETLLGSGTISTIGGQVGYSGGNGRIRLERLVNSNNLSIVPAPSVVDLPVNPSLQIWPPSGSPEVRILSIGGETAPADPRAAFGTFGADVSLPVASSVPVIIETVNVEPASVVTLRITPRDTYNAQVITATRVDPAVSSSPLTYHWTANVPTNLGYSALQVKVVRP